MVAFPNIESLYENPQLFACFGTRLPDKRRPEIKEILNSYLNKYFDIKDDKQTWFDKMKDLAEERGYAREVKEYKANPENYKGHVGDISTVIRVALTGRHNTPDLYEIMQILGKDSITNRINKICGGN